MKVKELKEILANVDEEKIVILQKDSEGNGYSPLQGVDNYSKYRADSTYSGEVGYEQLTPSLESLGYTQEDVMKDGVPALILYPIN